MLQFLFVAALMFLRMPSATDLGAAPVDDKLAQAQQKFVEALRGDSLDAKKAALDALVALNVPEASPPLIQEFSRVAEELRDQSDKALKLRYGLERRQVVLDGLKAQADHDPKAKELLPAEEEQVRKLQAEFDKAQREVTSLTPWRDALSEGMAKLFIALGPTKNKKSETEIWKDAADAPDTNLRMASVDLLGRVGGPGTAVQLHDLLVTANEQIVKLQARITKSMVDVRKLEKRLQDEQAANGGRADPTQYNSVKADAAAAQTQVTKLQVLVEIAVHAGGVALARETGKDLDKSMAKLVAALKKTTDRSRVDTLKMFTVAKNEALRVAVRALLDAETEPIGIGTLIDGLAALDDKTLAQPLIDKYVAHENWHVRARAAYALARLRSREGIPALIARLEVEKEGRVRTDLDHALRSLTAMTFHGNAGLWQKWWKDNETTFKVPDAPADKTWAEEASEASGVTFFGITTESQRVLFVLDLSGSMKFSMTPKKNPDDDPNKPYDFPVGNEPSRLDVAKRDLVKALGGLKDGGTFNLVLFASDVWTWSDDLETMSNETRTQVKAFIDKADAVGGTNIYGALERALDLAGAKGGDAWSKPAIDTIYFLTDGRPTVGVTTDTEEILSVVRQRNKTAGIVIHTIGLSDAQDAVLLRRLAEENGGQYVSR
jgi:HEAT repeat protein